MPSWAAGLIPQKEDLSPALSSHSSSSIAGPKEQNWACCASPDPRPSKPALYIRYTLFGTTGNSQHHGDGPEPRQKGEVRCMLVVKDRASPSSRGDPISTSQWSSPVVGCCSCKSQVSQTRCCCSSSISHWLTFYSPVSLSLSTLSARQ